MKVIAISLMLISFAATSFAQGNGGQADSNASIKVRVDPSKPGKVTITNLQSCPASIEIKLSTGTILSLPEFLVGLGTRDEDVPVAGKISVRSTTNCPGDKTNNGWLEINVPTVSPLPIKFESVDYKWLSPRQLQVTFKVAESSGKNEYHVRASYDGVTWVDKYVLFPETTQPNSTYVTKINF